MAGSLPIYRVSAQNHEHSLRQTEILSNLIQTKLRVDSIRKDPVIDFVAHPFTMILTQDCDLEQDFALRLKGANSMKLLPSVLFCEIITAEELYSRFAKSETEWKDRLHIPKNKNDRFHFLQVVNPSCDALNVGLPEMGIDFKRYFSVPTDEVYKRIELKDASRRCVMRSPYLEHLSLRFATYLGRVALPEDHLSQ